MRSASASESSGVIRPISRRRRPRLSSSRVRSGGSSSSRLARRKTSTLRVYAAAGVRLVSDTCQSRLWHRTCLARSVGGRPAQLLRRRAPLLRLEPALARGLRRLRRDPPALDLQRLPQLLDQPLDCQLAVPPL